MSGVHRKLNIAPNGMIDPAVLKSQFDNLISEHNESAYLMTGNRHLKFKQGFGVVNLPADHAYSKFVIPNNTANPYDHATYHVTDFQGGAIVANSSNTTFFQLEIPEQSQAFTTSAGIAKAFRYAVGYRPGGYHNAVYGTIAATRNPRTAGYADRHGFIIRDNSVGIAVGNMNVGQHCFAPAEVNNLENIFKVSSVYSRMPQFATVVVRNTVNGGAYATAPPYYIQLRVGTDAPGFANTSAADGLFTEAVAGDGSFAMVSLRLLGFYV